MDNFKKGLTKTSTPAIIQSERNKNHFKRGEKEMMDYEIMEFQRLWEMEEIEEQLLEEGINPYIWEEEEG